jgi:L-ascorbate metabolism protein UlaG (beta-lactamase superfamily)
MHEEVLGMRAKLVSAPLLVLTVLGLLGLVVHAGDVVVSYLGHSCFTIQAEGGPIVMIDPYATYVPYPGLPARADIVLITHQHIDHCPWCFEEYDRVEGDPILVYRWDDAGRCQQKLPPGNLVITEEFKTQVIEASHVTASGGGQGWVCMFSFEIDGIRFAHLADLGKVLTTSQVGALSDVDVLFLPVGGAFTIDAEEAMTVIGQLPSVKVVFPMHYFVAGYCPWTDMAPLDDFTDLAGASCTVRTIGDYRVTLDAETLPRSVEVWLPEYKSD